MKSVTEQLTGEPVPGYNGVDPLPGDPSQLKELVDEGIAAAAEEANRLNQGKREKLTEAKLKVAFATRGVVAKPTGVIFRSPGRDQNQEIFDDGSVRNPYKVNREMSGRQRRKMRKATNRKMRANGLKANIADVLKGRRVGTRERPQQEAPAPVLLTPEGPTTLDAAGTPVALDSGDQR